MKLKLTLLAISLLMANVATAATAIDLRHQPINALQGYLIGSKTSQARNSLKLEKIRSDVDQNQIMHQRLQQTYAGVPVWGATAIIHTAYTDQLTTNTTMNGVIYKDLEKDLSNTPRFALSDTQKVKAIAQAKLAYEQKIGVKNIEYQEEAAKTVVFVDDNKEAHYAYIVTLYHDDGKTGAHRPTTIVDATSLKIYHRWDLVKTEEHSLVGGIGGNKKIGARTYDSRTENLPALNMTISTHEYTTPYGEKINISSCLFSNNDVEVQDVSYDSRPVTAICDNPSAAHNNLLWVSLDESETRWDGDEMNGGFSPSLDAFYAGTIIKKLYQDWYGIPPLVEEDGKTPMKLIMRVHYGRKFDNAFWDGKQMTFGDGGDMFYPLTSLDVSAHEISHGFTQQHSNLDSSYNLMGALDESFSDMASAAAEYYTANKNTWEIGNNIMKGEGAMRYMDDPKKDGMSIDNMKDYYEGGVGPTSPQGEADPHLAAGIFNKAFYLIATTSGWDTHKAFNVMVKANMYYWNASMKTLTDAACGVVSATKDEKYNVSDVADAFMKVGIDTSTC